jgi:hypothetical protein
MPELTNKSPSQGLRIWPQEAEKKDDVEGGLAGYAAYITRVCRHDSRLKGEGYIRGKEEEKQELSLKSDKNDVQ